MGSRVKNFPQTWLTRLINLLAKIMPHSIQKMTLPLPASGLIIIGKKAPKTQEKTCTFIVPVYNEANTFPVMMTALLAKRLPKGLKKSIIVIESNSSDGTRNEALKFANHPQVQVILQEKARGKGNAVREGFMHANGDIIIIQDGDLEYDMNDLDDLITPVLQFQAPFVLGSRHGGRWKMRQFEDKKGLSNILNFGHLIFTQLLNLLYGQKLKDPFTMYKVFRRDCLHDLRFESNRFDFDFELVIKLIRKGYIPVEIPINYQSRSFKAGKKVRVFRDPLTWIWALIKYRFSPIYEKNE